MIDSTHLLNSTSIPSKITGIGSVGVVGGGGGGCLWMGERLN